MEQEYFKTDQKLLTDLNDNNITELYSKGYVFTRVKKGLFNQTRSLRINLKNFELNSENRRILRKNENLTVQNNSLPYPNYTWDIHKLGKDFYTIKFGDGTMSASKIKEMFLEPDKSNMNCSFSYQVDERNVGYCLSYKNSTILHYAYPFYSLEFSKEANIGMAMMLKAIIWAKENEMDFVYLGSVVDSKSKYKLQFEGLEWFDTESLTWVTDLNKLKELLK